MQPPFDDTRIAKEVDRFCDEFERQWRVNANPRIEEFLPAPSAPTRSSLLQQLLLLEWDLRVKAGDRPSVSEYSNRFPTELELVRATLEQRTIEATLLSQCKQCLRPLLAETPAEEVCPSCGGELVLAAYSRGDQTRDDAATAVVAEDAKAEDETPPRAASAEELPRLGRYALEREVARGGMGIIYKARDETLGRALALKVMRASKRLSPEERRLEIARFLEEAKLSAQLEHPGIIPVHEMGRDDDMGIYFTMRLVKGKHLGEVFELARSGEQGWNLPRAVGVIVKACEALAYAHSKKVIHRDLKPANIMVGRFGAVYVMDWGLAKVIGKPDVHDIRPLLDDYATSHTVIESDRGVGGESSADTPLITMDGSVIGTPAYMPPEQAKGLIEQVDDVSDVYSLGAILYNLLTGRAPYVEPHTRVSPHTILAMVIQGPPPPVAKLNPQAAAVLAAICEKAMARDKTARYTDSLALAEDLQAYLDGRVVRAYRTGAAAEFRSWVTRNLATAVASAAVVLAVLTGLAGIVAVQQRYNRQVTSVKEATRRFLYDGNMRDATQAWQANTVFRVGELLDRHRPRGDEKDLRSFEWYYLDNLRRRSEQAPRLPHEDIITTIAFSPDGQLLATGCNDGVVRIWDAQEWQVRKLPGEHQAEFDLPAVDGLVFTPDGSRLISVGRGGDVLLRNVSGQDEAIAFEGRLDPWSMARSPDGRWLAGPDRSGREVLVWDLRLADASDAIQPLAFGQAEMEGGEIHSARFTPDGEQLLTSGLDGVARLWRIADGRLLATFGEQNAQETWGPMLALSSDGQRLALVQGNSIAIWDVPAQQPIGNVNGPAKGIKQVVFAASGDAFAAVGQSEEGEVMIWRIEDQDIRVVGSSGRHHGRVAELRAVPGTDRFVTAGGSDNVVQLWDANTGSALATFRGHANELYGMAVAPDGGMAATGGRGHEARVWNLNETGPTTILDSRAGVVWSATFSADGETLYTACEDGQIRIWDVASGASLGQLPDQRTEQASEFPAHAASVQVLCLSKDGDTLASCGKDGQIKFWSLSRRKLIGQLSDAHAAGVDSLAYSPDGRTLYSSSDDGFAKAWDVSGGPRFETQPLPIRTLGPFGSEAWCLVCSPTANVVAVAGTFAEHEILLFDLAVNEEPRVLFGHGGNVTNLRFSADGKTLASSSQDGSIRLWDVATAKELPSPRSPLRGHSGDVQSVALTDDGLSIVSAGMDGTIQLWDRETGEAKSALRGHAGGVQYVTLSPDGTILASTSWDGSARLWRAPH